MKRLIEIYKEEGVVNLVKRIVSRIYDPFIFLVHRGQDQMAPEVPEGVRLVPYSQEWVERGRRDQGDLIDERRLQIFLNRLKNSSILGCFAINSEDEILAWAFLRKDCIEQKHLKKPIPLKAGEAYYFDLFTQESGRRKGLQEAMFYALLHQSQAKKIITFVAWTNVRSRAMMRKLGFKEKHFLHVFHLGQKEFTYFKTLKKEQDHD